MSTKGVKQFSPRQFYGTNICVNVQWKELATECTQDFAMKFTEVQFNTIVIQSLFDHYQSDLEECIVSDKKTFHTQQQEIIAEDSVSVTSIEGQGNNGNENNESRNNGNDKNGEHNNRESADGDNNNMCGFCFS